MADISAVLFQNSDIEDGIVIATVYIYTPSTDFKSAVEAYPKEAINGGGSIPGGNAYPDETVLMEADFSISRDFDASQFGESIAVSEASVWLSYVASQVEAAISTVDSKANEYDDDFSTASSLVDPT